MVQHCWFVFCWFHFSHSVLFKDARCSFEWNRSIWIFLMRGKRCNWFNEWMKNMRFKGCYDVVLWLQVSSFRSVFNLKMIGSKTNKYWIYTKTQAYSFHTFIFLFIIISTRRPYIYTLFLQYDLLLCCFFLCLFKYNFLLCFITLIRQLIYITLTRKIWMFI